MSDQLPRRDFLVKGLALGTALAFTGNLPCCMLRALAGEPSPQKPGDRRQKPVEALAYCSFDCETECDIYKATRENDLEVKKSIAKRWNEKYATTIKPEDVACDGCRSHTGRLGYHCGHICGVRKCALSRGVSSCAVCADFPACEQKLWKDWTAMRQRSEARRRELQKSEAG